MSERDRLAAELLRHQHGTHKCSCGWEAAESDWMPGETGYGPAKRHIADALLAAGVTMPAPPCPACYYADNSPICGCACHGGAALVIARHEYSGERFEAARLGGDPIVVARFPGCTRSQEFIRVPGLTFVSADSPLHPA